MFGVERIVVSGRFGVEVSLSSDMEDGSDDEVVCAPGFLPALPGTVSFKARAGEVTVWVDNQLHATQVNILVRAIQLLKVGGCVCYSTCSLNPTENEAVVAEALRRTRTDEADVELVEFPDISGLIRRKGIREWRVADYTGEDTSSDDEEVRLRWHTTWQDAVDSNMDKPRKSMWPCSDTDALHLERCTRLWPHDKDSGGFFLALIRKKQ